MNKPHKGKKGKRIILCAGFFTLIFFLFAGKTIMAAGYSDEELIKIYTDYSDLFKQNDLVSNAFRSLGCGVLSFLVVIADGASGLFEKSFGMIDFTKYQPVQDFISDWQVVWVALLCVAIGWLGINLVFNSDKNPKIATNICVVILVVTSMTWMVSQMNTLLTKGIRNEILGTTTTNTVYATLGNNVHDLRYIDSVVGLGNLGSKNADGVTYAKAGTPMTKKIWKALKINEIVNPDDVKDESKDIVENYKTDIPTADGKVKSMVSECYDGVVWTDLLNTYYYRYEIDWLESFLEIISIAIIYLFFSYKVVRTLYEVVFSEILAMLYSPNLTNGQKTIKILDGIKDSYIIIMLSLVSVRLYMIATEYISGKNWNGFTKGMFLLFIAFAVIDGPNLVQRITGLDAGLSDGMQKVMSAYYAGGMMAGAARGAGHIASGVAKGAGKFGKTIGGAVRNGSKNANVDALNGAMGAGAGAGAAEAFNNNNDENNEQNENKNNQKNDEGIQFNEANEDVTQNENGEAGNSSSVSEDGKNSLDANADAAGNKRAMDDAGINGMNPDNAKADALNGINPLGDGGSMIDKTSRMDKELDMENATSTFNGNGERGVLSSKSDLAGKYGKAGANSGFTSRAGDNFGKNGANNYVTGTKENTGISQSSNKKASGGNAAQKLKKGVFKNK